jgi:hypothetical protein
MQEIDADRRAALLRGRTPPPLPDEPEEKDSGGRKDRDGHAHGSKRRKLAGEDDTDMELRLAAATTTPNQDKNGDARTLKLRNTNIDAPLTDHAGHIDLFPVDAKEAIKREKNAEVEREKRKKERALEDQYTMRFSNAAGRDGLAQPWYAAQQTPSRQPEEPAAARDYPSIEEKNVWGNEDPRRKERAKARLTADDPLILLRKGEAQLAKYSEAKKKLRAERDRELKELKVAQECEEKNSKHHKRRRGDEDGLHSFPADKAGRGVERVESSKHRHHRRGSRSRSRDRAAHKSSHRHGREHSRDRASYKSSRRHEERSRDRADKSSRRHGRDESRDRSARNSSHRHEQERHRNHSQDREHHRSYSHDRDRRSSHSHSSRRRVHGDNHGDGQRY